MRNGGAVAVVFVLMLALVGTAGAQAIPWPDSVEIKPPAEGLDPVLAASSGIWEGRWDFGLASRLAVEEISAENAVVVYAWSDHPQGWFRRGWLRIRARVLAGGRITWGAAPKFTFTMRSDRNSIAGVSEGTDGSISRIVMYRRNP
jgi:hypothetical protein